MAQQKILVVDDEADIRELLEITLIRMGLDCVAVAGVEQAIDALKKQTFCLCLTDMNLGNNRTGIDVIEHIQQKYPYLPVAMITAYGNMETAISAMKAGAFDYVTKPIDLPKLRALVKSALKIQHDEPSNNSGSTPLLGNSAIIQQLHHHINKLARSLAPVFIFGESGSGKELVARLIHQQSARASQPFIAVNCGAIPSELMESEFFGYEKGSFTGAQEKKIGLFKAAEGGTLFLDEVADLPKDMQVKLLRAIQEKSVRPIGSTQELPVDVRILSATHKNLAEEVKNGSFRQDLFYRINVIELHVPSLKERPEDIEELSHFILDKIAKRYEQTPATLENDALKQLQLYSFPGNVRELENILERAFTLCENNCISKDDLRLTNQFDNNTAELPLMQQAVGRYDEFIENIERSILQQALEQTQFNKTQAAELLGISFRTIRYKLQKFNMD